MENGKAKKPKPNANGAYNSRYIEKWGQFNSVSVAHTRTQIHLC